MHVYDRRGARAIVGVADLRDGSRLAVLVDEAEQGQVSVEAPEGTVFLVRDGEGARDLSEALASESPPRRISMPPLEGPSSL